MLLTSRYSQPQLTSLNIIPVGHKTSWSRHWQLQLDSSQTLSDCWRHMFLSDKLIHSHLYHEDCLWDTESSDHLHSSGWYSWRLWQWCSWTWHWQPQLRWRVRLVSTILELMININQLGSSMTLVLVNHVDGVKNQNTHSHLLRLQRLTREKMMRTTTSTPGHRI